MKKKVDDKASSVTDSSKLVEIRTAIERLRSENKELDIRIGILVGRENMYDCRTIVLLLVYCILSLFYIIFPMLHDVTSDRITN